MTEATFWNGEPCKARQVRARLSAWNPLRDPERAWWRPYERTWRDLVEVTYNGQVFYLDDEGFGRTADEIAFLRKMGIEDAQAVVPPGRGWLKVTDGRGMPQWGHSEVRVDPATVTVRDG